MAFYVPPNEIPNDASGSGDEKREKRIKKALSTKGESDHDKKTHNAVEGQDEIHIFVSFNGRLNTLDRSFFAKDTHTLQRRVGRDDA